MIAPMKARVILGVIVLGVLALGVGAGIAGISQIRIRTSGERTVAQVSECARTGGYKSALHCSGAWTTGGSLLAGGHVVVGNIEGAGRGDVGHTIAVRLSGDGQHAYTPSLATPIVYIVVGLAFTALGLFLLVSVFIRGRRTRYAGGVRQRGQPEGETFN
jgi:hypothetical protein